MAVDPNPSIWNSDDSQEVSAINYGLGDAGTYLLLEAGTEYHVWNDKGMVKSSSKMICVKVSARDDNGDEVKNITKQHWLEIKSLTIHEGVNGGDASGETDDNMTQFQPVGLNAPISLGNIPADCYRKIMVRVKLPNSAIEGAVTFQIYVLNQEPSTPIAKWTTELHGNGVVYRSSGAFAVSINGGDASKLDIEKGFALIDSLEGYYGAAQQYDVSELDDGIYKLYLTSVGVISAIISTSSIPSNSIELYRIDVAGGVATAVTDKRLFLTNVMVGLDAAKTATPTINQVYIATDTNITYVCYVDDIWSTIGIKNNFVATVDPTRTSDITDGYSIGSQWLNTYNAGLWECIDNAEDAAVWAFISKYWGGYNVSTNKQLDSNHIGLIRLKPTAAQTIILPRMYDEIAGDWTVLGDQEGIRIILEVATNIGDDVITIKTHDDDFANDIFIGLYESGLQTYTKLRDPGDRIVLEYSYYGVWEIVYESIGDEITDIADAVTKKHTQNTDTDLDDTFEATFIKKTDTVNVLSDITSAGAEIEDAVTHKDLSNNPHAVTKTQVSLGNVTDDSQLKRAAGDINTFDAKAAPISADLALIEDSADSNNKKKIQLGNIPIDGGTF